MYSGCNCNSKEKVTGVAESKTRLPESSIHARQGSQEWMGKIPRRHKSIGLVTPQKARSRLLRLKDLHTGKL